MGCDGAGGAGGDGEGDSAHARIHMRSAPLELGGVHAQVERVKAMITDHGAIKVCRELAAREPAGTVVGGRLHRYLITI